MGIRNFLRKAILTPVEFNTLKAEACPRVTNDPVEDYERNQGRLPPRDSLIAERVYQNAVWVYACVFAIASKIAAIPMKVYEKKSLETGKKRHEVHGTFVGALLESPNTFDDWYDVMEGLVSYLELSGNGYMEKATVAEDGHPCAIYNLRSDLMKIIPDKKKRIAGYIYNEGTEWETTHSSEEISHLRYFNPLSEQYGMSPVEAATNSIVLDLWAVGSQKDFYKHGARPEGIIESDKAVSDKAYKRLRRDWKERYSGAGCQHHTPMLDEGMKYKSTTGSAKDHQTLDTRKMSREEILAAHGVPPVIVGLLEHASFANAYQQERGFWKHTLIPKTTKIIKGLNRTLVTPYDNKIAIAADEEYLKELTADRDMERKDREQALKEVSEGARLINEYRQEILNKEVVEWGNTWWQATARMPVSDEAEPEDINEDDVPTEEPEDEA